MRRFNRQFSQKPRLRDNYRDDRHSNWLGLLYDLVAIAVIFELTRQLAIEYDWDELGRYGLLFLPLWWTWCDHNFYVARFDCGEIIQRLHTFSAMVGMAVMAFSVPFTFDAADTIFATAYVSTRSLTLIQYIRAGQTIPEASGLTGRLVQGYGIGLGTWLIGIAVPAPSSYIMWGIGLAIEFFTPVSAGKGNVKFPANFAHLRERFGIFTIVMMGAAVITTIQSVSLRRFFSLPETSIAAGLGLVFVLGIWWDYYESSRVIDPQKTQVSTQSREFWLWTYSHLPLHASIPVIAVGFQEAIRTFPGNIIGFTTGWLLAGAVGVCMISLGLIWAASPILAKRRAISDSAAYFASAGVAIGCGLLSERVIVPLYLFCLTGMFLIRVLTSDRDEYDGEEKRDKKRSDGSYSDKRDEKKDDKRNNDKRDERRDERKDDKKDDKKDDRRDDRKDDRRETRYF